MGLGKPKLHTKFEVAVFIYYGYIRKFVFKNSDKPKWGNFLFWGETDFTVGFADPMFPIRCATFMELRLPQMGDFYAKLHFTMENFKFWGPVKWGLNIFTPNYQKAHPYAKSGRPIRLVYVSVALFWHYTAARKKVRENRHWKVDVVYNTAAATAPSWLFLLLWFVKWFICFFSRAPLSSVARRTVTKLSLTTRS